MWKPVYKKSNQKGKTMARTVIAEKLELVKNADSRKKIPALESLVESLAYKVQALEAAAKKKTTKK